MPDELSIPVELPSSDMLDAETLATELPPMHGASGALTEDDVRRFVPLEVHSPAIRQSGIRAATLCPRYYLFRERLRIGRPSTARPPSVGSLFHRIMDLVYSGEPWDAARATLEAHVQSEKQTLTEFWAERPALDRTGLLSAIDTLTKAHHTALAMAAFYLSVCPAYEWKPLLFEERIEVVLPQTREARYAVRLPVSGKLDRLIFDEGRLLKGTPGYWIIEYKVPGPGIPLQTLADIHGMSVQTAIYRLLAAHYLAKKGLEAPLLGMLFCMVRRCDLRLCAKDRPAPDQPPDLDRFIARVGQWYRAEGEYLKHADARRTDPIAIRRPILFSGPVLTPELYVRLWRQDRLARARPQLSRFCKNTDACFDRYGRPCMYLPLCTQSPRLWANTITNQYTLMEPLNDDDPTDEPSDSDVAPSDPAA